MSANFLCTKVQERVDRAYILMYEYLAPTKYGVRSQRWNLAETG